MEKIVLHSNVRNGLDELIDILYYQDYFSYKENAVDYVNAIYDFILTIPLQLHKKPNTKLYGSLYCSYKSNKRTTWYIFFDIIDDVYQIKFITNNHTAIFSKLI
jgi:hypothetical protein